jgi:hypothetical protein
LRRILRGKCLGSYKKHTCGSSSSTVAFEHGDMHEYF